MNIGDIFNTLFFQPIANLLVVIFHTLTLVHLPGAFGFSIILLSIFVRMVVWPFMATQIKSAKKMADLKPKLDALKEKHKDDKQAFATAQMALYKEEGVNPAGGCLPVLIQLPIFWALYQTIFAFFSGSQGLERINNALYPFVEKLHSLPDLGFLGMNLSMKPSDFSQVGIIILLIPVVTAVLQLIQSKMMAAQPVKTYPADTSKEKKEKASAEDSMAAMQSQMMFMMPLMVGYFAFQFPIGLALYWNTFTILGILQQYLISGWGGLTDWMARANKLVGR